MHNKKTLMRMYYDFFQGSMSYEKFYELFNEYTKDYSCLLLNSKNKKEKISNNILFDETNKQLYLLYNDKKELAQEIEEKDFIIEINI